jgi:proteasome accessory factor B
MGDNQEYRYLIANEDFRWPKGITLSAKQVALMNLAAKVWAKASLSTDANRAIHRIRAMGESPSASELIGIAPRITTHDLAFLPLSTAIETCSRVSFEYKKPGEDQTEVRNVEPWSLQNISGQWLLIAFDLDRDDPRNFLLKRITSEIDIQDVTFEPAESAAIDLAIKELSRLTSSQIAKLKIKAQSAASFHFNLEPDQEQIEISYMDVYLLAEQLMEFAPEIEILQPARLREIITGNLTAVAKAHA